MELYIPRIDLGRPSKGIIPILNYTLIETVGCDAVRITRNTLDYCQVQVLPATVKTPGSALLLIPDPLKGAVTIKDNTITRGVVTTECPTLPVGDFPETPTGDGQSVLFPDFQAALDRTLSATSLGETKGVLKMLKLKFCGRKHERSTEFIGCDGSRLAIYTLPQYAELPDFLVDSETLNKHLPKKLGKGVAVSIASDQKKDWASFAVDNFTLYLPLSDAQYPEVHNLLPIGPTARFSCDVEALRAAIAGFRAPQKTDKIGWVKFTCEGLEFFTLPKTGPAFEGTAAMDFNCEQPFQPIHFQTNLLLNALPPKGLVTFRFDGPIAPCVLEGENSNDYQLLMPLRR